MEYKFLCADTPELLIGSVLPSLAQEEVLLTSPCPCIDSVSRYARLHVNE